MAVLAATLLAAAPPAGAQTITFDPADFPLGPTSPVEDGYGAAAGVATTYRTLETFGDAAELGVPMRWWDGGHGALTGVAYGQNRTASVAEVGLSSTVPGGPVTLTGFDIGSWGVRSRTLFVRVLGWDYAPIHEIEAPIGASHFSFADYLAGLGAAAPTHAVGIRIQWTQDASPATPAITGRGAYDAGIDNVAFAGPGGVSTVPEPATMLLVTSGLAGLGGLRLARRRARRR